MQSHSGSSKATVMAGLAAMTIGAVAWSGHLFTLLALLVLPMVFKCAKAPAQRLTILGCYYAASIWPVMPGATQFFGNNAGLHPLSILILWLVSSLVLTLPWVWLLLTPGIKAEWALPIGLCLTALLPTGVVNPLTVAGVLFPGLGWAGLIATIILFGTLSKFRLYSILSAAMLAAICYVSHPGIPTFPPTWQGHDTELGGSELSKQTPMALYKAVVYVQETSFDSNALIQVFPEGIINHWTPTAEGFWQSTYSELQQKPSVDSLRRGRVRTSRRTISKRTSPAWPIHRNIPAAGSDSIRDVETLGQHRRPHALFRPVDSLRRPQARCAHHLLRTTPSRSHPNLHSNTIPT